MSLERSLVEFPFLGLQQKTDAKLVTPGNLLRAENAVFTKDKEIRKRNGARPLKKRILGAEPGMTSADYATAMLSYDPLLYYRLGESIGATVAANLGTAGSAKDGAYGAGVTLETPGLLTADTNTAMAVAGDHDFVVIPQFSPVLSITDFTFVAWINPTNNVNTQIFFTFHRGADFLALATASGEFIWYQTGNARPFVGAPQQTLGVRQMVVLTRVGSALTLYVDSVAVGTDTWAPAISSSVGDIEIGNDAFGEHFVGTLDEMAFLTQGLSADDVAFLYAVGTTGAVYTPGDPATIDAAQHLATLDDELLLFTEGALFSFAGGVDAWMEKGVLSPVTLSQNSVIRNTYQQKNPDAATLNGTTLYVWADSRGGSRYSIVDEETGAPIVADTLLSAVGRHPRAVAIGRHLLALYIVEGNLVSRVFNAVDPTQTDSAQIIAVDVTTTADAQHLDVSLTSVFPAAAAFAYTVDDVSGFATKIGYVTESGQIGSPVNGGLPIPLFLAEDSGRALTVFCQPSTGDLYVLTASDAAVRMTAFYAAGFIVKVAPMDLETTTHAQNVTGAFDADDVLQAFWELDADSGFAYDASIRAASVEADGTFDVYPQDLRRSVGLGSKAFLRAGTGVCVVAVHDSTAADGADGLQNTYFLLQSLGTGDLGPIIARMQPGQAGNLQIGGVPTVVSLGADSFFVPFAVRTKFISEGNTTYSLLGLTRENFSFGDAAYRAVQIGEALLVAGGVVGEYDGGAQVVESGFHLAPENATVVVAAGGSLEPGRREICFVFEWTDEEGQEHRSAPSVPVAFDAVLNNKATCTVPTLRLTEKTGTRTNLTIAAYSTEADGVIFYKTPNGNSLSPTADPLYNNPYADSVTFVRKIADADILANEILYTQGPDGTDGPLANDAPQSAAQIFVSKNRAFIIPGENRRRVFFSKEVVLGVAPSFSDFLYIDVDPTGGDLTAGFVLDDKVVLFKRRRIEVVLGDGPDADGSNDTFSVPALVTTDVGCTNPDSLAIVPAGIVFQSDKGLYLLDRSLATRYIGAPVEDAMGGKTITSATLLEAFNEVRFTTADGTTAVWNYFFDRWSTFTNQPAVHALIWEKTGNWVYALADGTIMEEADGYFYDDKKAISMVLMTAWFALAGIQGFQRVRSALFLGNFFSNHLMQVQVAFDYAEFTQEYHPWNTVDGINQTTFGSESPFGDPAGGVFGGGDRNSSVYQFQVPLARQKCEAVRFLLQDLGSGVGKAYSLNSIALEIATLKGGFRNGPAKIARGA